jgi:hypothetical protein
MYRGLHQDPLLTWLSGQGKGKVVSLSLVMRQAVVANQFLAQ